MGREVIKYKSSLRRERSNGFEASLWRKMGLGGLG
jgi:hypothetical protein